MTLNASDCNVALDNFVDISYNDVTERGRNPAHGVLAMISTRYGTVVESFVAKDIDEAGNTWVRCILKGMTGERDMFLGELRADGGIKEIANAVAELPLLTPLK